MAKVKVGVIGCGGIGQVAHITGFQACPQAEVTAICDIDETKLAAAGEKFGVANRYTDYKQMLKQADIDAVSIGLPNYLHAPVAIAAFQAGKHVMCEKPLAFTAREAEKMIAAAEKTGKVFMVGQTMRFYNPARVVKRYVEDGVLGNVYYAKASLLRQRGIPGFGGWFTTKKCAKGGALIDIGVHILDLTVWLMGCPEPVAVSGQTWGVFGARVAAGEDVPGNKVGWPPGFQIDESRTFDVDDLAAGLIRFNNGAVLVLEASWAVNAVHSSFAIHLMGDKGGVELVPNERATFLVESRGNLVTETPAIDANDAYKDEMAHFIECIQKKKKPVPTPEQGLRVMKILDALYKSAETGREVTIK